MIQAKFGLNWPSGFRGEDFFESLQTLIRTNNFLEQALKLFPTFFWG
jgi:hypothetical protein